MGSLDKRIEALERLYAESTAEESTAAGRGRKELVSKALSGTLDAMAHIKRAPIDREPWCFEVENLKDKGAVTIAYYVAALTCTEHPDEERAREILEEAIAEREIEGAPLWVMIDSMEVTFNQMKEEIEEHGA